LLSGLVRWSTEVALEGAQVEGRHEANCDAMLPKGGKGYRNSWPGSFKNSALVSIWMNGRVRSCNGLNGVLKRKSEARDFKAIKSEQRGEAFEDTIIQNHHSRVIILRTLQLQLIYVLLPLYTFHCQLFALALFFEELHCVHALNSKACYCTASCSQAKKFFLHDLD
jgi:hypothetical protein